LQSTYLVAPGSSIQKLEDVNREGVRIAGVANTATGRASAVFAPKAATITVAGVDAGVALIKSGGADAIALSRESLAGLAGQIPGARVLDGGFLNSTTAVAVPRGRPRARAFVTEFIEAAKASGDVRKAMDAVGLTNSMVAPAGMKP
jgi:polar amino acid transport system substrate-binding protein